MNKGYAKLFNTFHAFLFMPSAFLLVKQVEPGQVHEEQLDINRMVKAGNDVLV